MKIPICPACVLVLVLFPILAVVQACNPGGEDRAGGVRPGDDTGKSDELAAVRTAPEQIAIDGRSLTLDPYLWRDFMPISPPGGKPLRASLRVRTPADQAVPEGLSIARVYVLHDEAVWETVPQMQEDDATNVLQAVARDGPKWEPGTLVDVVVRLRTSGGETHLLAARNVTIERTD